MWTKNIEKASIALQLLRKIDEGAKTHEETKAEVSCRDHHCPAGLYTPWEAIDEWRLSWQARIVSW